MGERPCEQLMFEGSEPVDGALLYLTTLQCHRQQTAGGESLDIVPALDIAVQSRRIPQFTQGVHVRRARQKRPELQLENFIVQPQHPRNTFPTILHLVRLTFDVRSLLFGTIQVQYF